MIFPYKYRLVALLWLSWLEGLLNRFDSNFVKETIRGKRETPDDLKPQICIVEGTIKNPTWNNLHFKITYRITTLLSFSCVLFELTFDCAICFQTGPQSSVSFKYKSLVSFTKLIHNNLHSKTFYILARLSVTFEYNYSNHTHYSSSSSNSSKYSVLFAVVCAAITISILLFLLLLLVKFVLHLLSVATIILLLFLFL